MAILNSNGIVTFTSIPVDAPTNNGPSFGRLIDTNTFYYYNGSAWVAITLGSDVAYDATTWNTNLDVPTKNAIRDKFEAVTTSISSITSTTPLMYKAILSQTGVAAPTATVIYNTLGEVPTLGRADIGEYVIDTVGDIFTLNKTLVHLTLLNGSGAVIAKGEFSALTRVSIVTFDDTGVAEELIGSIVVSIEVYP